MEEERESGHKIYYFVYRKYFSWIRCSDYHYGHGEENKFSSKEQAETILIGIKGKVIQQKKYKNIISRKIVDLEEK